jgi:hypothetical protein
MTSPVHAKVEANNLVLLQQSLLPPMSKIIIAAMLTFGNLGNFLVPSMPALSTQSMPAVIPTQAKPKVNLSVIVFEEEEVPTIQLLTEVAIEARPHMIAYNSFLTRVSGLESDVANTLPATGTTEWNDNQKANLRTCYDTIIDVQKSMVKLLEDHSGQLFDLEHRIIQNKSNILKSLRKAAEVQIEKVDPYFVA